MTRKGHGEQLTRRQEQAIASLLRHRSIGEAARAVRLNEKTVRAWLKLPTFERAYRAARRQLLDLAIAQLQRSADAAAKTLQRNLKCGHAGTEVRAALGILDQAIKATELEDLAVRVAEIEERLEQQKGQ